MGECKDNMKTSDEPKKEGLLGRLRRKRAAKSEDKIEHAVTFADMIEKADERLSKLIETKENEAESESGREDYNQKQLARLRMMMFHLDQIATLTEDYSNEE